MQTPFIALLDEFIDSDEPHYKKAVFVFRNIDTLPRTYASEAYSLRLLGQSDEIILDFRQAPALSEEWARWFVRLRMIANREGKRFSIIGASDNIIDLYENMGLYNVMCNSFQEMETQCLLGNF